MNKVIHFLKYHNLVPIVLGMVSIVAVSALAASPQVREAFISSQDIPRSIDNSGIIAANLENFDFGLKITGITEDTDNYYIVYTYQTIYIQDYVWQPIQKEKTITVSKAALGDKDLGLYAAEELGEVIDSELSYLKEVQTIEKEKGLTQKIVTTQYAGLIGRFLSPEEKVFEGYQPVVQEGLPTQPQIVGEYTPSQSPEETSQGGTSGEEQLIIQQAPVDRELIRQIVQEILTQQSTKTPEGDLGGQAIPPAEQPPTETPPACQPTTEICDGIDNNCDGQIDEGGVCQVAPPVCTSNWQCSDWQPLPETTACGQTFTQTRTCTNSNNCGADEGKPAETQEAAGSQCSADNATGTCQAGTCAFTCQDGFSNCDNDMANGCEVQGDCLPAEQ